MKSILLLTLSITLATNLLAQNDITIAGSVRPHAPISIVGQKSMIAGTENGVFETWIFPYQICHGFQLSYQNNEATIPIPLAGLAQNIEARPEATTITFSHPLFTIRETIFASIVLPALVARVDTPIRIVVIDYGLGQGDPLTNGKVHMRLVNSF